MGWDGWNFPRIVLYFLHFLFLSGRPLPSVEAPLLPCLPHLKCVWSKGMVRTDGEYAGGVAVAEDAGSVGAPFAAQFNGSRADPRLVVVDDDGCVDLLAASGPKLQSRDRWVVHNNAVFDVTWCQGDTAVATASGDMTARVSDLETRVVTATMVGHVGSVKSVRSNPLQPGALNTLFVRSSVQGICVGLRGWWW